MSETSVTMPTRAGRRAVDRWATAEPIPIRDALAKYNAIRAALGARSALTQGWRIATIGKDSVKLAKDERVLIGGVTLLPARQLATWFADASPTERHWATVACGFEHDGGTDRLESLCRLNLCAHSTRGCRAPCLINTSGHYGMSRRSAARWFDSTVIRAQLARTLLLATDPAAYLSLEVSAIARVGAMATAAGIGSRWRVNVGDDWPRETNPFYRDALSEYVTGAYAYTKFPPGDRPDVRGVLRFCRSASELTTVDDIRGMVAAGATVAVPMIVGKRDPLPTTWRGMRVVDGDKSDDRWSDPTGVVVGLRGKFGTLAERDAAIASGFFRAIDQ